MFEDIKKLGFGLMRLPLTDAMDESCIDIEQMKKMVDLYLAAGFRYFDTAWLYHEHLSEPAVKEALVSRYPREAFALASKLPDYELKSKEDRDRIFNAQRQKTGVDYFDYYLLHSVEQNTLKNFEQFDCFNWLLEKKEQGFIRHMGFSYHDSPELLNQLLDKYPFVEFVQLQLNYLDWEHPVIQSRRCYETAILHGKKVVVMEPIKGGTLAALPEKAEELLRKVRPDRSIASWAIRFAASLDEVAVVLSGMSNLEQMADNIGYMREFEPLTKQERQVLDQVISIIDHSSGIPCTGCSYCTIECPEKIPIPRYFALYNVDIKELKTKAWTSQSTYYSNLTSEYTGPDDCLKCGRCETHCPQHLPIRDNLQKVSEHFRDAQ